MVKFPSVKWIALAGLLILCLASAPGCGDKTASVPGQGSPAPTPPSSPVALPAAVEVVQGAGSAMDALFKPTPAPAQVQETAQEPAAPVLDEAIALQVEKLDQEIEALKTINEGRLPAGFALRDLFAFDLTDPNSVEPQIRELEKEIEKLDPARGTEKQEAPSKSAGAEPGEPAAKTPDSEEPVHPDIQKRRLESLKLRLSFLRLPPEKHEQILEQESGRKFDQLKSKIEQVKKEITALELILDGRLPEEFELRTLFEIDPRDSAAVKARIEALKAHIQTSSEQLTQKEQPAPADKTPPQEGSGPDAPVKTAEDSKKPEAPKTPSATSIPAAKPGPPDQPESPPLASEENNNETAGQKAEEPHPKTQADLEKALAALQLRRDKLRLAFLELSDDKRTAILEAEDKRNRIAQEKAAAEKARLEAELAERKAEQARQKALEEERLAVTSAEKAIAKERARTEQARGALAGLRLQLSESRQKNAEEANQVLQQQDGYRQRMAAGLTTREADVLYNQVVHTLTLARRQLKDALDRLKEPSIIPPFKPEIDLDDPRYLKGGQNLEELKSALMEVIEETGVLIAEEQTSRWSHAAEMADDVKLGNDLRLELIPALSAGRRRAVLGFGREGIAQMFREIDQLNLMSRFYFLQGARRLQEMEAKSRDLFTLGAVGLTVVKLLFLVGLFFFAGKHYMFLVSRVRNGLLAGTRDRDLRVFLDRWFNFAVGIAPSLGWLLFAYLLFAVLDARGIPEMTFLRLFVLAFFWYRVCLNVALYYITGSVRSLRIAVSDELKGRIMRSIRIVLRYVFPVIVFLTLSDRVLGHGYLFRIVVNFFWIGALPIAAFLLRHWRMEIAENYCNHFPQTGLATRIRSSAKSTPNLVVTLIAFLFVTGRRLRLSMSDSLSRFRGTRKAFSYLFRRQLEKQAESLGLADKNIDGLPEAIRDAFSEQPPSPEITIDWFPQMEQMNRLLAGWKETGNGAAVALVGESGIGRTTWLNEIERRHPQVRLLRAEIDPGARTEREICGFFSRIFGIDVQHGREELIETINRGPARLVILDQCQNVVFRAVGGMMGFSAFAEIIGRTTPHMFWICAFSGYAWQYAQSVSLADNVFRDVFLLKPWNEETIHRLIDRRMEAAKVEVSYEDLIVDRVDGTAFENEVIRTGERYRQLLCDYADGIPRVALHFWLRSLVPAGDNRVKVRLFNAPSADELEWLSESSRFMLAALVIHQNLTIEEAAQALNYRTVDCKLILDSLTDREYIEEQNSRFTITAHWQRAIVRYLRRKHLLYS